MITSIGFKNFRKFRTFPSMSLAPITILVGGNNAGKSTLVKALLTVSDFRSCVTYDEKEGMLFHFDMASTRIGTFCRALCNKSRSNTILFEWVEDRIKYEVALLGDPENKNATTATVVSFKIWDLRLNFQLTYDFAIRQNQVIFHSKPIKGYDPRKTHIPDMQKRFEKYFASISRDIKINVPLCPEDELYGEPISELVRYTFGILLAASSGERDFRYQNSQTIKKLQAELSDDVKEFILNNVWVFRMNRATRSSKLFPMNLEYVYAHAANQTVLYPARNEGDYVTRTIHAFAAPHIQSNKKVRPFILKWMKKFEIGVDYRLDSVSGEAHMVRVKDTDGKEVFLADKGMGSIQLMILLFRVAINIAENNVRSTIILEEPELNLHPKMQSMLADFFYEMLGKNGSRFIIETHSEYLIRKTQVIVKNEYARWLEEGNDRNPFKVYYMDGGNAKQPYYEMEYQPDGAFANDFGEGFFDEASNLAFEIL
jgi:AAA15 family ATPase/GTPase